MTAPSMPNTKGKRLGQHAFIGRVALGRRGGSMRVLSVFENWAGKCAERVKMNMRSGPNLRVLVLKAAYLKRLELTPKVSK